MQNKNMKKHEKNMKRDSVSAYIPIKCDASFTHL